MPVTFVAINVLQDHINIHTTLQTHERGYAGYKC